LDKSRSPAISSSARRPGGKAAAIAYTLIATAKLNGVDPQTWLADTLAQIPDYRITKVDEPRPWRWSR